MHNATLDILALTSPIEWSGWNFSGPSQARLGELEGRAAQLEAELANAEAPAPRLHPNLAEVDRERIAELARVPEGDDAAEAQEEVRGLVEAIRLVPERGALRIEVRGEFGAILRLAEGA